MAAAGIEWDGEIGSVSTMRIGVRKARDGPAPGVWDAEHKRRVTGCEAEAVTDRPDVRRGGPATWKTEQKRYPVATQPMK